MPKGEDTPREGDAYSLHAKINSPIDLLIFACSLPSPHPSSNRQEFLDQIKYLHGLGIELSIFESNPNFLNYKIS